MITFAITATLALHGLLAAPDSCDDPFVVITVQSMSAHYRVGCDNQAGGFNLPSVGAEDRPETLPPPLATSSQELIGVPHDVEGTLQVETHKTYRFIDAIRPLLPIPKVSNRYRTWHYELRVPPGWVGFIGDTTFDRSSESQVIRGVFRDRYVPWLIGNSLRSFRVQKSLVIMHPEVEEHPLRPGERNDIRFRHLTDSILNTTPIATGGSSAPIIVIGGNGSAIAFDHPSGLYWHERMVEGDSSPIHWKAQRIHAAKRSYLRFSLTSKRRASLVTELDRQRIEWDADHLLEGADAQEGTSLDTLEGVAVIPEIDQFLADPQVPFSGALGRFQNGTRTGYTDTPWGWERERPDGDWLRTIAKAFNRTEELSFDNCTSTDLRCRRWAIYPLPSVDLVLSTLDQDTELRHVQVDVLPPEAASVLPDRIDIIQSDGEVQGIEIGVPQPFGAQAFPLRIAKHHAQFELPTATRPFPHFNNQTEKPWRWMLNSVFGLVGAVGGNFTVAAQFAGRPLYASSPKLYPSIVVGSSYLGAGFSSSWNFGRYTQALSRAHNVGAGMIAAATDDDEAGWLPSLSIWTGYRWSTKISQWDYLRGSGFSARLEAGASRRDDLRPFLSLGVGALTVTPMTASSSLALRLRYNAITGPDRDTLGFALGSRDRGIRGISLGLFKVPERWLGTVELRSVLGRGYQDILGLVGLTQLRGTLFTDIAYLPDRGVQESCPEWVGSSGIGLQWLGDMVGIAPGALTLDIGIPIRSCDDTKWEVYLGFVPPLVAF